ncbi:MAG: hypothetical protein U9N86_17625 [Bacteroidota bacterium]|nr:hypothetical protein [Bacteroidota bacterium]
MKKEDAIKGMTLNEIIVETQDLADSLGQYSQKITMPRNPGGTNEEENSMTITFKIGGYLAASLETQMAYTDKQKSSIAQGFGVIQVYVRALWGGHYYRNEPIEDTVANIHIVDRRTECMGGSYSPDSFENAAKTIQCLLDNPKDEPLI